MEQLKEENHRLMLKLENLKKSHSTEVEYVREEQDIKEQEFKQQLSKLREEAKAREGLKNEKIQALNEEINSLREEHEESLAQSEKLRVQVDILKNAKSAGAASSYSEYEGLKESQRTLKAQLLEKDELLTSQTEKIRGLGEEIRECRNVIVELTEVVEGKDSIIKEMKGRVSDLEREKEEECGGLQNEVLALKEELKALQGSLGNRGGGGGDGESSRSVGGGSRGNSLFSEVEERRLKVENELTRMRNIIKRLQEENRTLQMDLERGDTHSAAITSQLDVITKSEHELDAEIKRDKSETLSLFDSYRDRLDSLRTEYTRKLQQYKLNAFPQQTTELESLRKERDSFILLRITMEREINELKRELKYNKHLRTNAEANTKIVKAKLDLMKQLQQQPQGTNDKPHAQDANANLPETVQEIEGELKQPKTPQTPNGPNPLIDNRNKLIKSRKNDQECNQQ